jgi:hypothetical protein
MMLVFWVRNYISQNIKVMTWMFHIWTVNVNWRYDMDVRSWGIKDISIYTTSVVKTAMLLKFMMRTTLK